MPREARVEADVEPGGDQDPVIAEARRDTDGARIPEQLEERLHAPKAAVVRPRRQSNLRSLRDLRPRKSFEQNRVDAQPHIAEVALEDDAGLDLLRGLVSGAREDVFEVKP